VQTGVARFARVCTYDRAGYAWSELGPFPRSYEQINDELATALAATNEAAPYVLVGHSYGAFLVRAFARDRPALVAGVVFAEATHEDQYVSMRGSLMRLRDLARSVAVPPVQHAMGRASAPPLPSPDPEAAVLHFPFDRAGPELQALQRWAQAAPELAATVSSEFTMSDGELLRLAALSAPGTHPLGARPVVVISRAPRAPGPVEDARVASLSALAGLSSRSSVMVAAHGGHELEIEEPEIVVTGIRMTVDAARSDGPFTRER
jgi:pimeloyl-ACP methyl ester carboxylesterase